MKYVPYPNMYRVTVTISNVQYQFELGGDTAKGAIAEVQDRLFEQYWQDTTEERNYEELKRQVRNADYHVEVLERRYPIVIFLINRKSFEETGVLRGEWLGLPTDAEALQNLMQRLEITDAEDLSLQNYDTAWSRLHLPENADLNELNYLSERMQKLSSEDSEKIIQILATGQYRTPKDYINLLENLNSYEIQEAATEEAYGKQYLEDTGKGLLKGFLQDVIDYKALGRYIVAQEQGMFMDQRYIRRVEPVKEVYNGDPETLPESCRILGKEKDNAYTQ